MYSKFFGLKESPFSIAPDPRYLYMSERHREALAHLLYGVSRYGGFVLLTGEVGTGKTTVCRCFLEQVPDNTDIAFIIHPRVTGRELLASICDELHLEHARGASTKVLVDLINQHLLKAHANGRHTVVVIDEAQNLSVEVLEQLRLLTNLETSEKKLLQIVLLGQPELLEILQRAELRQLSQRITARYHLKALSRDDVRAYVYFRLSVAGLKREIFTPTALLALYKYSQGVPRLINLICDRALLGAYARHTEVVDKKLLKQAAGEVLGDLRVRRRRSRESDWVIKGVLSGVTAGLLTLAVASAFTLRHNSHPAAETASAQELMEQPPAAAGKLPSVEASGSDPATQASHAAVDTATMLSVKPEAVGQPDLSTAAASGNPAAETAISPATTPFAKTPTSAESSDDAAFEAQLQNLPNDTKVGAYRDLFKLWGLDYVPAAQPIACNFAESAGLRCLQRQGNWRSLWSLDRPAIMKMLSADGVEFYVLVKRLQDNGLVSVRLADQDYQVKVATLDALWAGDYALVWRVPPYQSKAPNHPKTDENSWLSERMDRIAELRQSLQGPNAAAPVTPESQLTLTDRIRNFQLDMGLTADGIAGAMTLIHLNSLLDPAVPRLSNTAPDQQLLGRN